MNPIILACDSLEMYVAAAQKAAGTDYPVHWLDRKLHAEPKDMKTVIEETLREIPAEYDTILVAMGYCGGAWDHVTADRQIILPRVDDCVSLLLTTDDSHVLNRKAEGHLYILGSGREMLSPTKMYQEMLEKYEDEDTADYLFECYFSSYHALDIVDTGYYDCHSPAFTEQMQKEADRFKGALNYVPGSNTMLEKLLKGIWDEQFLVAQAGHVITLEDCL